MEEPFLGRTEEQNQFRRQVAAQLPSWQQKYFPTFSKPFTKRLAQPAAEERAQVMLFYGEGGMGKTKLVRRLRQITTEAPLRNQVRALFLDWESEQKQSIDLQVGHDNIEPKTVLATLHRAFVGRDHNRDQIFVGYRQQVERLKTAEQKVEKAVVNQPDNPLLNQVSKWGAQGIAWIVRQQTGGIDLVPSAAIELGLNLGAEGLHQVRQLVQRALTPEEYQVYEQPNRQLAEALGKGIAALAQRQPLVLILDTYEIVDRPECDYTLRAVIQASGNALWVIAGRANLATSGQRDKSYFRGYRQEFSDRRLYVKELSEFSLAEIQQYFEQTSAVLEPAQAEAMAQFSLGIPFVVSQAAAMWREGKPMAEIVAPVPVPLGQTARDLVVKATCERFLMHCFVEQERTQDLQAIYALAMMRRPNADLLRQMLDAPDLETTLQRLRQRYSFIWVEQLRLDEKLSKFLREYLQTELRRTDRLMQELNQRAQLWLQLQREAQTRNIVDRAEWFEEEAIAETLLDVVHHSFWQGPEAGWRELVPRFVESWQYSRAWGRSLFETVELFWAQFDRDAQRRYQQMVNALSESPDLEDSKALLADLEKLAQRKWLDGDGAEERRIILQMRQEDCLYRQQQYDQALALCLQLVPQLPQTAIRLKTQLAEALYELSSRFTWATDASNASYSAEGERAIEQAIELQPDESRYYANLGTICAKAENFDQAIAAYQTAIQLDPKFAASHNGLGTVYKAQNKQDEAIAAYQSAIQLDPKFAASHNNLGTVYQDQNKLDEAIAAYQTAIQLDPKFAAFHYNLGNVYQDQNKLDEAIAAYQTAIQLDPKFAAFHYNLGNVYKAQNKLDEAIAAYQTAIQLDPTGRLYNNLGNVYQAQNKLDEAIAAYQTAIQLDPKDALPHNNLGNVYQAQNKLDKAIAAYQTAIQLESTSKRYNNLGWVCLLANELNQAQEAFEKAIELDSQIYLPVLNLGLIYALQDQLAAAKQQWQKGLELCQGEEDWTHAIRSLYKLALGDEQGLTEMQQTIETGASREALQAALSDAEVLARCPTPPDRITEMIEMLKAAISNI